MSGIAESHVEEAALAWLGELGYAETGGLDIGPDATTPERVSYGDVSTGRHFHITRSVADRGAMVLISDKRVFRSQRTAAS